MSARQRARDSGLALVRGVRRVGARGLERGGFETAAAESLADHGLRAPDRNWYKPSGWLTVRRALRVVRPSPADVFIDVGSGKGRVVYQAARFYPFRRVIGVEIAPLLTAAAQRNLDARKQRLRCQDVVLVTADIVDWEFPDDVTVAYLFNPFTGTIFDRFLEHLLSSLDRRPRDLWLVYGHPLMHQAVLDSGRFVRERHLAGRRGGTNLYRATTTTAS